MTANNKLSFSLVLAAVIASLAACSVDSVGPTREDNLCLTNLFELNLRLKYYSMNWFDRFPTNVTELAQRDTNTNLGDHLGKAAGTEVCSVFVCPATGHKAGLTTNLEQWTDYIFFANEVEISEPIPLLVCPPENHGGKFGHVLWQGGPLERVSPTQVRALVEKPWCMGTNELLKGIVSVQVPKRLKSVYTNAYKPPATGSPRR